MTRRTGPVQARVHIPHRILDGSPPRCCGVWRSSSWSSSFARPGVRVAPSSARRRRLRPERTTGVHAALRRRRTDRASVAARSAVRIASVHRRRPDRLRLASAPTLRCRCMVLIGFCHPCAAVARHRPVRAARRTLPSRARARNRGRCSGAGTCSAASRLMAVTTVGGVRIGQWIFDRIYGPDPSRRRSLPPVVGFDDPLGLGRRHQRDDGRPSPPGSSRRRRGTAGRAAGSAPLPDPRRIEDRPLRHHRRRRAWPASSSTRLEPGDAVSLRVRRRRRRSTEAGPARSLTATGPRPVPRSACRLRQLQQDGFQRRRLGHHPVSLDPHDDGRHR